MNQLQLHIEGKAGRDAVRIKLVAGESFRLDEDLVTRFSREPMHLVLDRWAITRADALDHAREHWGAIEAAADDLVGSLVRMRNPAGELPRVHFTSAHERKDGLRLVARLLLHDTQVDGSRIQARGRSGLKPADGQTDVTQAMREAHGRRLAGPPRLVVAQPDMDLPGEKGTGRHHYRSSTKPHAALRSKADGAVALEEHVFDGLLKQLQVRLIFQPATNGLTVENAVRLGARSANRGTLRGVENTELDARFVSGKGHRSAEGVDLFDEMALADPADRRVAGHLSQRLDAVCQQKRAATHARGRERGFASGMAAADHDHIEFGIHAAAHFTRPFHVKLRAY
jgi:hypothetical protein